MIGSEEHWSSLTWLRECWLIQWWPWPERERFGKWWKPWWAVVEHKVQGRSQRTSGKRPGRVKVDWREEMRQGVLPETTLWVLPKSSLQLISAKRGQNATPRGTFAGFNRSDQIHFIQPLFTQDQTIRSNPPRLMVPTSLAQQWSHDFNNKKRQDHSPLESFRLLMISFPHVVYWAQSACSVCLDKLKIMWTQQSSLCWPEIFSAPNRAHSRPPFDLVFPSLAIHWLRSHWPSSWSYVSLVSCQ